MNAQQQQQMAALQQEMRMYKDRTGTDMTPSMIQEWMQANRGQPQQQQQLTPEMHQQLLARQQAMQQQQQFQAQQQFGLQQQAFVQQQQQQQQQPSAAQLLNHLFPPHLAQDQRQSCLHLSAAVFPQNGNNSTNPDENPVLAQLMTLAKNQQLTSQQMQILKAVIGLRNAQQQAQHNNAQLPQNHQYSQKQAHAQQLAAVAQQQQQQQQMQQQQQQQFAQLPQHQLSQQQQQQQQQLPQQAHAQLPNPPTQQNATQAVTALQHRVNSLEQLLQRPDLSDEQRPKIQAELDAARGNLTRVIKLLIAAHAQNGANSPGVSGAAGAVGAQVANSGALQEAQRMMMAKRMAEVQQQANGGAGFPNRTGSPAQHSLSAQQQQFAAQQQAQRLAAGSPQSGVGSPAPGVGVGIGADSKALKKMTKKQQEQLAHGLAAGQVQAQLAAAGGAMPAGLTAAQQAQHLAQAQQQAQHSAMQQGQSTVMHQQGQAQMTMGQPHGQQGGLPTSVGGAGPSAIGPLPVPLPGPGGLPLGGAHTGQHAYSGQLQVGPGGSLSLPISKELSLPAPSPEPFPGPRPTLSGGLANAAAVSTPAITRPPPSFALFGAAEAGKEGWEGKEAGLLVGVGQEEGVGGGIGGAGLGGGKARTVGKRKVREWVESVDPEETLSEEVEDLLLEIVDEFVDSTTRFACLLAKHRHADKLEAKDLALHLERSYALKIPGFQPLDEVGPAGVGRSSTTSRRVNQPQSYLARLAAVKEASSFGKPAKKVKA